MLAVIGIVMELFDDSLHNIHNYLSDSVKRVYILLCNKHSTININAYRMFIA